MKVFCIVLLTLYFWSSSLCFSETIWCKCIRSEHSENGWEPNCPENLKHLEMGECGEAKYDNPVDIVTHFSTLIKSFIDPLRRINFLLSNIGITYIQSNITDHYFDPEIERFARSIEKLEPSAKLELQNSRDARVKLMITTLISPKIYMGVELFMNIILEIFVHLFEAITGEVMTQTRVSEHLLVALFEMMKSMKGVPKIYF